MIDAETQAHARAKFAQAFPGSTLTRLEEIHPPGEPSPVGAGRRAAGRGRRATDEELAALRARAHQLTQQLRTKLGCKIRV
jgi:hypothetical protein